MSAEAVVTRAALDLFSRILLGQVEEVEQVLRDYYVVSVPHGRFTLRQLREFRREVGSAKAALGLPRHGSLSIFAPDAHPAARLAYQLARQEEGATDEVTKDLIAEADAAWEKQNGRPWYGLPLQPAPAGTDRPAAGPAREE